MLRRDRSGKLMYLGRRLSNAIVARGRDIAIIVVVRNRIRITVFGARSRAHDK